MVSEMLMHLVPRSPVLRVSERSGPGLGVRELDNCGRSPLLWREGVLDDESRSDVLMPFCV